MTNEEKAAAYADERLEWRDSEFAQSKYSRHTKMGTNLFAGCDIEEAFLDGAEWKEQQMIKKAVEWFENNFRDYAYRSNDLLKAMEV